jgi:hypothetical protein
MKKGIIFFSLVVYQSFLFAQFRYGFTGGALNSSNSIKSSYFSETDFDIIYRTNLGGITSFPPLSEKVHESLSSKYSFYAGMAFELMLNKSLALRSKFLLDNKGWRERAYTKGSDALYVNAGYGDSVSQHGTFNLSYLSFPFNLIFYAHLKSARVFFGPGLYLSYGLFGHFKVHFDYSNIHYFIFNSNSTFPTGIDSLKLSDSTGEISFHNNKLNRSAVFHANEFDYGLTFETGIEFRNGFFIDLNYTNGLRTVIVDHYGYQNYLTQKFDVVFPNRNRTFNLGVGFFIK